MLQRGLGEELGPKCMTDGRGESAERSAAKAGCLYSLSLILCGPAPHAFPSIPTWRQEQGAALHKSEAKSLKRCRLRIHNPVLNLLNSFGGHMGPRREFRSGPTEQAARGPDLGSAGKHVLQGIVCWPTCPINVD